MGGVWSCLEEDIVYIAARLPGGFVYIIFDQACHIGPGIPDL